MTRATVTPEDVGRSCPYCRFPLKEGMEAERCDACGAMHHDDCWRDGHGCAVVGCVGSGAAPGDAATVAAQGAPTAVMATVPPEPAAPAAPAGKLPPEVPLPPAPPPSGGSGGSNRSLILGLIGGLAIAAAGVGGFALAGSDGEESPSSRPAADTAAAPAETTPPPADEPAPAEPTEAEVAQRIEAIVEFSLQGRTAVIQGRYQDAIENRRRVLSRLDRLEGATGPVGRARRILRDAMQASLASDEHYAAGTDASATDAEATRLKQQFVEVWNPIAREHGLASYQAGEI